MELDTLQHIYKRFNAKPGDSVIQIRGYGRDDLARFFGELGFTSGVEIGTERGKYARVLCDAIPKLHLTCIDPFLYYDNNLGYKLGIMQDGHDENYRQTIERTKHFNVNVVKDFSHNVAHKIMDESIQFCYIDGNHRLEYVVQDLTDWTPKVKKGGIIALHDYVKFRGQHYTHIPYAIHAYLESYGGYPLFILDQKDRKNKTPEENKHMDRIRSCFFVKQ